MNILITGAKGFVGRNLTAALYNIREGKDRTRPDLYIGDIYEYDIGTNPKALDEYCASCDFVFHLAGINRPQNPDDFMSGNSGFTSTLLDTLKKHRNTCTVMISSSTQAALDNLYGKSKKSGEDIVFEYGKETGAQVLVYRFPNIFGKWCRPNYNSAVATFCHNIARGLPVTVNDRGVNMTLVYIDDVIDELTGSICGKKTHDGDFCRVPVEYKITLGEIVDLIYAFKDSRENLSVPDMSNEFEKKLYSTYLSYFPTDQFNYPLKMNTDERGSFTEIIRTEDRGQFSVNISKPGIIKGNHWHNTKNEKFIVVSGRGVIRFRKPCDGEIFEYYVSGDKLEVIDIPVGYTHNIENLGNCDMVTFMWCNECFDNNRPDTYFLEV